MSDQRAATTPCPYCNDEGIVHDMAGNMLGDCDCVSPEALSNVSVGGRRLTWHEVAERQETELHRLRSLAQTLSDLNRCEHGRHEGDVCSGCGGPSLGNPFLHVIRHGSGRPPFAQLYAEERQIGFTLSGTPIVVPEGRNLHDPDAWLDSGGHGGDGEVHHRG